MRSSTSVALIGAALAGLSSSSPTPTTPQQVNKVAVRQLLGAITNSAQLSSSMSAFQADASDAAGAAVVGQAILTQIVPAPGPSSVPQLQAELAQVYSANPHDIFASGANILLNGLAGGDLVDIGKAYTVESNTMNVNTMNPNPPIYPKADSNDAPYSLTENQLRQVIYIPPNFTYGNKTPVLFLEGTASVSGETFGPNFGKLFVQNNIADPVYVNIPGMNLADIQVAAEYVAYAVGYISAISGHKNV